MTKNSTYQSVFVKDLMAGNVMVVTGGGSGIGRCVAHELSGAWQAPMSRSVPAR